MRKKLKGKDIRKNASLQVSHSINKIKENERRYTIILVLFFMCLFSVIGYFTLSINKTYQTNTQKKYSYGKATLSLSSENLSLTNEDIMTDELGLEKTPISLIVNNENDTSERFQIKFIIDNDIGRKCGCNNNLELSKIHYSTDFQNIIEYTTEKSILEDMIDAKTKKKIDISMWLDNSLDKNQINHIHGHFEISKK